MVAPVPKARMPHASERRPSGRHRARRLSDRVDAGPGRHGRRLPRRGPAARATGRVEAARRRGSPGRLFRDRFLRESELAASIDHPNIIPVYEAGEADGILFIAMRYVGGARPERAAAARPAGPGERDRRSSPRWRSRWMRPTRAVSSIATSSPPTSCSTSAPGPDGSDHVYLADFGLTQAADRRDRERHRRAARWARSTTSPPSRSPAARSTDGQTSTRSAACSTSASSGSRRFRRESDLAVLFAHLKREPPARARTRHGAAAGAGRRDREGAGEGAGAALRDCRELAQAALAVAVDEASRLLADVASRAAAGRSDLSEAEAELAGKVIDLQLVQRAGARSSRRRRHPARWPTGAARSKASRASSPPTPTTSSAGSGSSPSSSRASSAPASSASSAPREAASRRVLRAGLLPALAAGVLPGSDGWRPRAAAARRAAPGRASRACSGRARRIRSPRRLMRCRPAGGSCSRSISSRSCSPRAAPDAERAAFVDALARAAADPDGRAVVVVALRADFYGRFAAYPALAELLGANHVLVGPMQASELRRVVELPAGRVGLRVEPELTDALVDDVEGEPGALPLLSTALLELWQKRRDETLTLAAYRESGRRPRRRRAAGRGHLRAHPGGAQAARARDHAAPGRRGRRRAACAPSCSARRARPGAERGCGRRARDAGRQPPRHRRRGDRRGRPRGAAARVAAPARMDRGGRGGAPTAPSHHRRRRANGTPPGATRASSTAAPAWPPPSTGAPSTRSSSTSSSASSCAEPRGIRAETKRARRTNRRLRGLLAGVAVLLAAAVAGGILALVQRGEARDAETAQLAQRLGAQALVEEDLDRALLLARQAVAIDDSPQTRSSLLADTAACAGGRPASCTADDETSSVRAAVSPDGRTLAVADFVRPGSSSSTPGRTSRSASRAVTLSPGVWRASPTAPTGDARARRKRLHPPARRETRDMLLLEPADSRRQRRADRLHAGRRAARRRRRRSARESWVTVRRAATLEPVGAAIEHEASRRSFLGQSCSTPSMSRSHPMGARSSPRRTNRDLAWWDLASRRKVGTVGIDDRPSRARAQPGRSHARRGHRRAASNWSTRARGAVRATSRGLAGGLDLARSSARTAGRSYRRASTGR